MACTTYLDYTLISSLDITLIPYVFMYCLALARGRWASPWCPVRKPSTNICGMNMSFMSITSVSTTVAKVNTQKSYEKKCLWALASSSQSNMWVTLKYLPPQCQGEFLKQDSPRWDSKTASYFFFNLGDQYPSLFCTPSLPQQTMMTVEYSGGVPKPGARIRIPAPSFPSPETWQVHWPFCASACSVIE